MPEIEDDYTPLDPTYLPPGLEEEKPSKFVSEKEAESLEEEVSQITTLIYDFRLDLAIFVTI